MVRDCQTSWTLGRVVSFCGLVVLAALGREGASREGSCRADEEVPGRLNRWAVLATSEVQESGLADQLTASLSAAGFSLLERATMKQALDELKVGQLLEPADAKERLRLGKMLRADACVVLAIEKRNDKAFLRSVICDTQTGARLRWDVFPFAPANAGQLSQRISDIASKTKERFRTGEPKLIAVTPFLSREFSRQHNHWQVGLQRLLEQSLLDAPGVAVLEITEADAIRRELKIDGSTGVKETDLPVVVSGEFTVVAADNAGPKAVTPPAHPSDSTAATLHIMIRTSDSGENGPPLADAAVEVAKVPEWFTSTVAPKLLGRAAGPAVSSKAQVEQLEARAAELSAFGDWLLAAGLREAALLIDPDNVSVRLAAAHDYYCELHKRVQIPHKYASMRGLPTVSEQEWSKLVDLRIQWWHDLADHVETLIRGKQVTQHEACFLLSGVIAMASHPFLQEDGRRRPEEIDEPALVFLKSALTGMHRLDPKWGQAHVRAELGRFVPANYFAPRQYPQADKPDDYRWIQTGMGAIVYGLPLVRENAPTEGQWFRRPLMHDDRHTIDLLFWYLDEVIPPDAPPEVPLLAILIPTPYQGGNRFSDEQWEEIFGRLEKSPKPFHQVCGTAGRAVNTMWMSSDPKAVQDAVKVIERNLQAVKGRAADLKQDPAYKEFEKLLGWSLRDGREKLNRLQGKLVGKPGVRRQQFHSPVAPSALGQAIQFQHIDAVQSLWEEWMQCDETLDVMWSPTEVCVMRQRDHVENLLTAGGDEVVGMAAWDGRWIWTSMSKGVQVWSRDGVNVATLDLATGLPEWSVDSKEWTSHAVRGPLFTRWPALWIAPFAEGKAVIVGRLKDRTWVAIASLEPGATSGTHEPRVRILYRAAKIQGEQGHDPGSIEQGFQPSWSVSFKDPRRDNAMCVLIGRHLIQVGQRVNIDAGTQPLAVWPERDAVELWPEKLKGRYGASIGPAQYFFVGDTIIQDNCLALSLTKPDVPPVHVGAPPPSLPLHWRYLSAKDMQAWDGRLVVVGDAGWAEIDPTTQKVHWLHDKNVELPYSFQGLGTSAHYGLVTWGQRATEQPMLPSGRPRPAVIEKVLCRVVIGGKEPSDLAALYPHVPAAFREPHHQAAEEIRRLGGIVGNPRGRGATTTAVELPAGWKGKRDTWQILGKLHGLTMLVLNKAPLMNEDLDGIEKIDSLEWIDLVETRLTDDCLKHVGRLPKLRRLELIGPDKGTNFSDAGLSHLDAAPLDFISVFGAGFTDRFVEWAAKHTSVSGIDVDGTAVTFEGVAAATKAQPRLRFFIISK